MWIVCAGTDGNVTAEDVLFAGAIASELLGQAQPRPANGPSSKKSNDCRRTALLC